MLQLNMVRIDLANLWWIGTRCGCEELSCMSHEYAFQYLSRTYLYQRFDYYVPGMFLLLNPMFALIQRCYIWCFDRLRKERVRERIDHFLSLENPAARWIS